MRLNTALAVAALVFASLVLLSVSTDAARVSRHRRLHAVRRKAHRSRAKVLAHAKQKAEVEAEVKSKACLHRSGQQWLQDAVQDLADKVNKEAEKQEKEDEVQEQQEMEEEVEQKAEEEKEAEEGLGEAACGDNSGTLFAGKILAAEDLIKETDNHYAQNAQHDEALSEEKAEEILERQNGEAEDDPAAQIAASKEQALEQKMAKEAEKEDGEHAQAVAKRVEEILSEKNKEQLQTEVAQQAEAVEKDLGVQKAEETLGEESAVAAPAAGASQVDDGAAAAAGDAATAAAPAVAAQAANDAAVAATDAASSAAASNDPAAVAAAGAAATAADVASDAQKELEKSLGSNAKILKAEPGPAPGKVVYTVKVAAPIPPPPTPPPPPPPPSSEMLSGSMSPEDHAAAVLSGGLKAMERQMSEVAKKEDCESAPADPTAEGAEALKDCPTPKGHLKINVASEVHPLEPTAAEVAGGAAPSVDYIVPSGVDGAQD